MTINDTNIYNFNPDYIGGMISQGDWAGCWDYMTQIVENLSTHATAASMHFSLELQKNMQEEKGRQYAKDFGGLLGELFLYLLTDPQSTISDKNFLRLISYHETMHTLFTIHNMDNTDSAVAIFLDKTKDKKKLSTTEQKKLLLLLGMNTALDIVAILKSVDQQYRTPALIAYFSYQKIYKENIYNNKVKLYALRHEIDKSYLDDLTFSKIIVAFFLSSYLNIPDKHIIKENVNAACRSYVAKNTRELRRLKDETKHYDFVYDPDKPTVLVIAEVFAKNAPMYRGWGKMTKSIQNEFNVVFTMPMDKADPALAEDYRNFHVFRDFGDLYQLAANVKPDIIFMPSIGMRFYNVLMANMRMAPIQIMGLGHPATSMSDYIDYVVSPAGLYDARAFPKDIYIDDGYPEKHVPLLTREQFFAPLPNVERPGPKKVLKVGMVGSDTKVSYPFFKLLKEIVDTATFEIHLTFIIATSGVDTLYLEKYLQENFKNITYYGWQAYPDYINTIKSVDIVLNPFPFGHTNTVIDTLMCGKPCMGMDGIEPSSKTEGDVLSAVGLKDQFVATDEEDYKTKFFGLADRILKGETAFFDRNKIYDRIFAEFGDYDYSQIIKWIFDNNEVIKKSGKKYLSALHDV